VTDDKIKLFQSKEQIRETDKCLKGEQNTMNRITAILGMAAMAGSIIAPNAKAGAVQTAAPTAIVAASTQVSAASSTQTVQENGANETDEAGEKKDANEKEDAETTLSQDELKKQAKIDETAAVQAAKDAFGADKVADLKVTKLDMEDGKVIYELDGTDISGRKLEASVNAADGSVVESEAGDNENDANDTEEQK